ncbi:hypothetical protein B0H10DRAFT_2233601 [Mycena sp. CBHHK59/15]|nr:hypothetical protein B0H10DRAFT_2233601 [Mycena sp. CBHHK59/15]
MDAVQQWQASPLTTHFALPTSLNPGVANGPPNPTAPPQRHAPPSTPHPDPAGPTDDREAPPAYNGWHPRARRLPRRDARRVRSSPPNPRRPRCSSNSPPPPQHPAWAQQYAYAPPSLQPWPAHGKRHRQPGPAPRASWSPPPPTPHVSEFASPGVLPADAGPGPTLDLDTCAILAGFTTV